MRHFDQRTVLSRITMGARRDIHPGEELTGAYVDPELPLSARRRALMKWAFGTYMCDRCVREKKEEQERKKDTNTDTGEPGEAQENGEAEKFPGLEEELKEGLGLL